MDIGLIWDKYDSRLRAQVLKDLLALAAEDDFGRVQVQAPEGEDTAWLDSQLALVGAARVSALNPKVWRAYSIEQEPEMPECCEEWLHKDMRIQKSRGIPMRPNQDHYPSLDRQSDMRIVHPGLSLDLNRKPPTRPAGNQPVVLPRNYFYSPFL